MGLVAFATATLAALCVTSPGRVVADTKSYLYLDPDRFLAGAASLWDPGVGAGTVTHQTIGYLWPMGPFFWASEHLGLPDWIAQRLWLAGILIAAAAGTAYLLRTLGLRGLPVLTASVVYGLSPYVVAIAPRLSVILLPFAGLPWMLGLTIRALRSGGWRHPALFALVVATVGSINATALVLVGVAPVLWLAWAVLDGQSTPRRALAVALRIGVLTLVTSAWWIAGLWVQASHGLDILSFTETAQVGAAVSTAHEVLRGLGYWYFYGGDRLGPWIEPSVAYQERLGLLAVTYALPVLALGAATTTRWRHRGYFVGLLVVGVVLAVGAHPWDAAPPAGRAIQAFLESDRGLSMRSLPRAVPLIALAAAACLAVGVAAVDRHRRRWAQVGAAGIIVLAVVGVPALWTGSMVPDNLDRPEEVPQHWRDLADHLDAADDGTRVLEIPGSDFAAYRWGATVDPILPGMIDRPYLARELVPYGSTATASLLNALDGRIQARLLTPQALAPISRLLRSGAISVRSDLEFERFNTPRPRLLWDWLSRAPGLGEPVGFGPPDPNLASPEAPMEDELLLLSDPTLPDPPPAAAIEVLDPVPILTTRTGGQPLIVAGDGEGLVDLADAGLIRGDELIHLSASLTGSNQRLHDALAHDSVLVVTDSNRKAGRRWGTVRYNLGYTERADESLLEDDPTDSRLDLFPGAGTETQTVAVARGGVAAEATSFGNAITMAPEERPANAIDGDPTTAWRTAALGDPRGERIRLTFDEARSVRSLRLLQPQTGEVNRVVTEVKLTDDEGRSQVIELGDSSLTPPGQVVPVGGAPTKALEIEILADSAGPRPRYTGLTSVGFAEIAVDDITGEELIRPPVDLLRAAGDKSLDHDLALVMTRQRATPADDSRADQELDLRRLIELPTDRTFVLSGQVRLSSLADGQVLDRILGRTGALVTADDVIPGGIAATPSMAVDGDPTTAWQPPYGTETHWLQVESPTPFSLDALELLVRADGLHSLPAEVVVSADGVEVGRYAVPAIAEVDDPGAVAPARVDLGRSVTASTVRVDFVATHPRTTRSWQDASEVTFPIGIAELGLAAPVHVGAPLAELATGCRTDLLRVDDRPVPVRIIGSSAAALAGQPLRVEGCEPIVLPAGESVVRSAQGRATGWDLDRLVLRSGAGGETGASGPLADRPTDAAVPLESSGATRIAGRIDDIGLADEPRWLVLGQSHNVGWHARLDGVDLGEPALIDGFANGWLIPPDRTGSLELTFEPQRRVRAALIVSALGGLLCLALGLGSRRGPGVGIEGRRVDSALRAPPVPGRVAATFAVGAAVVAALLLPVAGAAVTGVVALALCTGPTTLYLTGPALVGAAAAWVIALQARDGVVPGYEWALEMARPHELTMLGIVLSAVAVGASWLRARTPGAGDEGSTS